MATIIFLSSAILLAAIILKTGHDNGGIGYFDLTVLLLIESVIFVLWLDTKYPFLAHGILA